jgi:hypothetical protein
MEGVNEASGPAGQLGEVGVLRHAQGARVKARYQTKLFGLVVVSK